MSIKIEMNKVEIELLGLYHKKDKKENEIYKIEDDVREIKEILACLEEKEKSYLEASKRLKKALMILC